jgi:hypothetical protein
MAARRNGWMKMAVLMAGMLQLASIPSVLPQSGLALADPLTKAAL